MACGKGLSAMTRSMRNLTRGDEERLSKIFNGQNAVLGEIPWQVGFTTNQNAPHFMNCGGALINPSWVISAMHCFDPAAGGQRFVTLMKCHKFQQYHRVV